MKKTAIIRFTFLCAALFAVIHTVRKLQTSYDNYQPASYQSTPGQETTVSPDNPFRGFLHMYGLTLSDDDPDTITERIWQYINSGNLPLMLIQINLKNYATTVLSDGALQQLENILSAITDAKRQVILRFLYDWDGKAWETEPDTIHRLIRHMDQVASVVNRYESAVFLIQGTFTGNCGEMTQTHYGSHEHNRLLMTHLSEVISPSIFLAVRTPSQLRGVLNTRETVTEENAFDGSLAARLGLFNDGMLGSVYDLGTYDNTPNFNTAQPEDKGTREEEIAFQNALCQFVPNGGEAVLDNPYNDFYNALVDLRAMHITYLNCDYDTAVMEKWQGTIYHGEDCFDGVSGYDYIKDHLGYRYVLVDSALSYDPVKASQAVLSFAIQNTGFAPSYRRFDGKITIIQAQTDIQHSYLVDIDNRTIGGGEKETFSFSLDLSGLPEGEHQVSFTLTDPYSSQVIRFASDNTLEDGSVSLGVLTVRSKSPGGFFSYLLEHLQNK